MKNSIYILTLLLAQLTFAQPCTAENAPYVENFELAIVPTIPNCTTILNEGLGNNWTVTNNPGFGFTSKTLTYTGNSNPANAWFFTKGINLVAGNFYTITFNYGTDNSDNPQELAVEMGTSPTVAAMTNYVTTLPYINNNNENYNVAFIPPSTNIYYFGFNVVSLPSQSKLFIDNINVNSSLNTNSFGFEELIVNPNPVIDFLNISNKSEITSLEIYNLLGQNIISKKSNSTNFKIDLSSLKTGNYFLKLTTKDTSKIIKLLKS